MRRARCADNLLYDEPPCTDYADHAPLRLTRLVPSSTDGPKLVSSPAELFQTATGLPLVLTLLVLLAHLACCVLQRACGSGDAGDALEADDSATPRAALKEAIARGGHMPDRAPLIGPGGGMDVS